MVRLITDTHAHLYWTSFDADREAVIERARAAGVGRMIVVGTDVTTSRAAFELCAGRAGFFPTAGIHPHDADKSRSRGTSGDRGAVHARGVRRRRRDRARLVQGVLSARRAGRELPLARGAGAPRIDKPLVVHCRDAHEDTLAVLRSVPGVRGVMHCYTMGAEELPAYLDLGFYISFSGVVTYPKNERNRAAARVVPLDRILFETDCPYLAPQGKRGKRNEPAFVRDVIEDVSRLRGAPLDELAAQSSRNAARLFALPHWRAASDGAWLASSVLRRCVPDTVRPPLKIVRSAAHSRDAPCSELTGRGRRLERSLDRRPDVARSCGHADQHRRRHRGRVGEALAETRAVRNTREGRDAVLGLEQVAFLVHEEAAVARLVDLDRPGIAAPQDLRVVGVHDVRTRVAARGRVGEILFRHARGHAGDRVVGQEDLEAVARANDRAVGRGLRRHLPNALESTAGFSTCVALTPGAPATTSRRKA